MDRSLTLYAYPTYQLHLVDRRDHVYSTLGQWRRQLKRQKKLSNQNYADGNFIPGPTVEKMKSVISTRPVDPGVPTCITT